VWAIIAATGRDMRRGVRISGGVRELLTENGGVVGIAIGGTAVPATAAPGTIAPGDCYAFGRRRAAALSGNCGAIITAAVLWRGKLTLARKRC